MVELAILCAAYAISLFYRGMLAVIAPELTAELLLDESRLGLLASAFFISFAIAQIPCGIALDKFGGRLTIAAFLLFAVLGTLLFSVADSYSLALLAQSLIGIGCAPVFTGTMLFIGRCFEPLRFAYITALVISIGSIGDLLGTTPLALLAQTIGWRGSMQLIALITGLVGLLCFFGLGSDKPSNSDETLTRMLMGMASILRIRSLWLLLPMFLASYAVLMAIRGVWSGPYLADIYHSDPAERGLVLMAMSVAMALGTFMLGWLDHRLNSTKLVVLASAMLAVIPFVALAFFPRTSVWFAMWAFVLIGLFGFNYPLLMSHSRTFLAPEYLGRGMAVLTAVSIAGVALIQAISGWLLEWGAAAQLSLPEQYRLLFTMLGLTLLLASLIYSFSRREGDKDQPSVRILASGKIAVASS
ncbi:MFS transporter [Amphritea balenae]|uniref:MFS transporter n=1 Tax=Amphritea balenae TaxID=452629 RepID=A0A3P1SWC5_9GAMM|nr:MFS transporter [Amphritea balenae]RRD01481.1 MFS transporter [Amphritea balenae]GGK56730.1 MFS transporter [Amphritea balenae]